MRGRGEAPMRIRQVTYLVAVLLVATAATAARQMFARQETVVNPFGDNSTVTWQKTSDTRSPSGYRDYAVDEYRVGLNVRGAFVDRVLSKRPLPETWVDGEPPFAPLWQTSPPGLENNETFATAFKVPISHGGKTITSLYKAARHTMWPDVEFWAWYDVVFRCLMPGEYTFGAPPVTEYHGATAALGKKYDYYFQYVVVTTGSGGSRRYRVYRQQPFTLRLEPQSGFDINYVYTSATVSAQGEGSGNPAGTAPTPPPTAAQPLLSIELKNNKSQYVSGERVVLTGSVKKLANGAYVSYGKQDLFTLTFAFPVGDPVTYGKIKTGDDGTFAEVPFAPYVEGTYKVTAGLSRDTHPELTSAVTTSVEFKVIAPPKPTPEQFAKIIELFKDRVESHQLAVGQEYLRRNPGTGILSSNPPPRGKDAAVELPEMAYGSYNNMYFGRNEFDPSNYNCSRYRDKTLRFLNAIRFSVTEGVLLRGIDYGPVLRGVDNGRAISGAHRAVVLYNHDAPWDQAANKVLDPWPKQKPEVFSFDEFRKFYGTEYLDMGRWKAAPDPEWELGKLPIHGGPVYWNLQWKEYRGPGDATQK